MERPDADEEMVLTVRKHPIGLVILYVQSVVGILAAGALVYFLLTSFSDGIGTNIRNVVSSLAVIIAGILALFLIVETALYRQNQLIVTDKTITQVLQRGLFSRKVSQLSLEDIEDVNSDVHGILPSLLGYGTLNMQTAGEIENFTFTMCPNVNACAKAIAEARQKLVASHMNTSDHTRP